ncbi:MAG: hypothetical protein WED00_15730 [Aquisalimonadaceae bacterium]
MQLKRHFFISDDLDDLERLEEELEQANIVTPQIHVLTLDDTGAANHHHLHAVTALMKKDIVHSTLLGASMGLCASIFILVVSYLAGWTETPAGWVPFIFLAIVALGFLTWEGGLRGIETPNAQFARFEEALKAGKHVFFVDLQPAQEAVLKKAVKNHGSVKPAGTGPGAPHWLVFSQHHLRRFFTQTFP